MNLIPRGKLMHVNGPGSIIETEEGSFIITTCEQWGRNFGRVLHEPRIENKLRIEYIKTPKEKRKGFKEGRIKDFYEEIPIFRFPFTGF